MKFVNGIMGLDLATFKYLTSEGDRRFESLGISFSIDEWWEFFFRDLNVPTPAPYVEGENLVEYDRKERELFKSALEDFPKLARIDDYYADAEYSIYEVYELLDECNRIVARLRSPLSLAFVNGLISGCKEAIESGSGLYLAAD